MADKKLTIVGSESGDWEELYVDGVSVLGSHSISVDDILEVLGIEYDGLTLKDSWLERNSMPKLLKDIPKKAILKD